VKKVSIPIVDGKYRVSFPGRCVYCGAAKEVTVRRTVSGGTSRRKHFATLELPYCTEHVRAEKRNGRILVVGSVLVLLISCCALFGITTSINRNPPVTLLVLLAVLAVGLAYGGRELIRKVLSRSNETMADMVGSRHLGLKIQPSSTEIVFSFANDRVAEDFARLNGQIATDV
jgi:hypothetical protein